MAMFRIVYATRFFRDPAADPHPWAPLLSSRLRGTWQLGDQLQQLLRRGLDGSTLRVVILGCESQKNYHPEIVAKYCY